MAKRHLTDNGALTFPFLRGMAAGAGLMLLLDPARGRRRRAMVRDRAVRTVHGMRDAVDTGARDLVHRASGLGAETRAFFEREPVADEILVERVRAALGRVVTHPHALEVMATNGCITIRGPLLAREVDRLLRRVRRVHGVKEVDPRLDVHEGPNGVPSLQGEGARQGAQMQLLQEVWAPRTRLWTGALAGLLLGWGAARRGFRGAAVVPATVLGLRAVINLPVKRILGLAGGRRTIDLQKTLEVLGPVEEVFRFWSTFENFPRFMDHICSVRVSPKDPSRSHWIVRGPAGVSVDFDAQITRLEPNRLLAWKTLPGSAVGHAGIVRFDPTPGGGTRLDVKLSYSPPGGVLGHFVAEVFRADPKTALDDDLVRMKSLIETGRATAHGHKVTRAELEREGGNE